MLMSGWLLHAKRNYFLLSRYFQKQRGIKLVRFGGGRPTLKNGRAISGLLQHQSLCFCSGPVNFHARGQRWRVTTKSQTHALTLRRVDNFENAAGQIGSELKRLRRVMTLGGMRSWLAQSSNIGVDERNIRPAQRWQMID